MDEAELRDMVAEIDDDGDGMVSVFLVNLRQETAISAQFVPGKRARGFDFRV